MTWNKVPAIDKLGQFAFKHRGDDIFGNQVVSSRTNQIEVHLDDATWQTYVDIFKTSTGDFTQANGQVTISTGGNAGGRYAFISKDFVEYRPHAEIGWAFTAKFPVVGVANARIRAGATDNVSTWANSVFVGYVNTNFGIYFNRGGVQVAYVPQAQWIDRCDGGACSNYTRDGQPVVFDQTKDQLFRVRAGLLGHAGFVVEIMSPDLIWVPLYQYSAINQDVVPVFENFDLKIGAEVTGAANLSFTSACMAGWVNHNMLRVSDLITDRTLAQVTRTIIEGKTSAGGGAYVPVKVTPSGALAIDGEITNVEERIGATKCYNGTATTAVQSVPAVAGDNIKDVVIVSGTALGAGLLQVSYDNGLTFDTMPNGSTVNLSPIRGAIKQLRVRTASGNNTFRAIIGTKP